MPHTAAARAAVLDLLALLTGVRGRLAAAPIRRGKPDRLAVWRAVLGDRSADAFPRQLARKLRVAPAAAAPVRDAVRAARGGTLYPAEAARLSAATATEYGLVVAAEVLGRLDEGLPRSPTRSWIAADEVADLGRQPEPLLEGMPADLAEHVEGELAAAGMT